MSDLIILDPNGIAVLKEDWFAWDINRDGSVRPPEAGGRVEVHELCTRWHCAHGYSPCPWHPRGCDCSFGGCQDQAPGTTMRRLFAMLVGALGLALMSASAGYPAPLRASARPIARAIRQEMSRPRIAAWTRTTCRQQCRPVFAHCAEECPIHGGFRRACKWLEFQYCLFSGPALCQGGGVMAERLHCAAGRIVNPPTTGG